MRRRRDQNLRIGLAGFAVFLGAVVIGCGGSSGGGDNTTDGTNGTREPSVNWPSVSSGNYGSIDVDYLTGAGRVVGDLTGVITRVYLNDGINEVRSNLASPLNLPFAAYEPPIRVSLNALFPSSNPTQTRLFDTFTLDLNSLKEETSSGTRTITDIVNNPKSFDGLADIRVAAGRRTGVQIFLDPSMFYTQISGTGALQGVFDVTRFREVNIPDDTPDNRIKGYYSDYLAFNISTLPAAERPAMTSGLASRVFFSGDGYGLSAAGSSGVYEALTDQFVDNPSDPTSPIPVRIPGRFSASQPAPGDREFPGTYDLTQDSPADISGKTKLISVIGTWYDYEKRIANATPVQVITFPSSREENVQDAVLLEQTVGTTASGASNYRINKMYFGYVEFNFNTGVHRIFFYNLKDLVTGGGAPVLTGTVTSPKGAGGSTAVIVGEVLTATYTLSDGKTGQLLVYRK